VDRPFAWRIGVTNDLSVKCPDCGNAALVTNTGIRTRDNALKLEAICTPCGRYLYLVVPVNPYALQQRGQKECPTTPSAA
jgi:ribosomal protein S27E